MKSNTYRRLLRYVQLPYGAIIELQGNRNGYLPISIDTLRDCKEFRS
ncbi:hypothetical protein EV589_3182 [Mycobacterium sp. BK558]|nr:hypothetical protein EV589_3182 [Mycobacterium sp. BK558]